MNNVTNADALLRSEGKTAVIWHE